ncbi:uncharacterized protein LOC133198744 [Saccostrea echinata]|uniref:uncharacterized protein LOC133176740 n=1 Tax=Saccostrea echinata TaxID=191078 RepID=UPI002A7FFFB5|nr:uncharacterized protein LOC133176740 [Saccostrea echinata]XP_061190737.1 uncharacterized protein LOC133198744 [Saccostrea echinata]
MYVGLCRKIGSPTIVRMRREVMDTSEVMSQPKYLMRGMDRMRSGSRREGFRLRNSDVDCMFWPPDHKGYFLANTRNLSTNLSGLPGSPRILPTFAPTRSTSQDSGSDGVKNEYTFPMSDVKRFMLHMY